MFQSRLSGCTFLFLLIILFLPLYDCFCPIKSLRLTRQSFILSAKYSDDLDDEDDDEDDYIPEVDVKNFKPPKTATSFGFNSGRSSPSIRKAMGVSGKSAAKVFVCTNCGTESVQWRGKCPTCHEWNTFQEFSVDRGNSPNNKLKPKFGSTASGGGRSNTWIDRNADSSKRLMIPNDDELNTVLGGGLVKGSLILLGGDPGVGKSTLALQLAAQIAATSTPPIGVGMGEVPTSIQGPVWYVSGEETMEQIASRAERLQVSTLSQLLLLSETSVERMANQVVSLLDVPDGQTVGQYPPSLIVIDSIQTMMSEDVMGSPGGVSQVRECMALLLRLAKSTKIPIICIGHVTKTGDVAGPRMVEHMVDAVLYLQSSGDDGSFRWLSASKNRFGSCQVVGLYEFQDGRLLPNPDMKESPLREEDEEGAALAITVEGGSRAMLQEVQALVTPSGSAFGKKTVEGFPFARVNLLLGVLQKHCHVIIGNKKDVYVNVAGASVKNSKSTVELDLAVAIALTSSHGSVPIRGDTVFLAQVGLLGELRGLKGEMEARLIQAGRIGLSRAIVAGRKFKKTRKFGLEVIECPTLKQALELGLTSGSIPMPRKIKRSTKPKMDSNEPNSLEDLDLDDVILDDGEDDEYDAFL
eukprot:CAMPEP_0113612174 /NCGR_PEP_ID=MMETSP0017_2-20120614/5959_1 /TAXON_ID=2856 /ORGANISM="Cylindrotheca closterium" /LENGTH=637 /DNA_ID=CAMNT_0000521191 /DNA_START=20 /DNA_END=1933 /DNA_ORIENTATION=+ /assembly_acc=CAM_ASM_000147